VGSQVVLRGCAVGDDAEVGDRCELGEGTTVPCGALVTAG